MSLPTLLTTEEVSEFLQVPLTTLYGWRTKNEGPPAIKVGRHLRYRKDELEAWLETRTS